MQKTKTSAKSASLSHNHLIGFRHAFEQTDSKEDQLPVYEGLMQPNSGNGDTVTDSKLPINTFAEPILPSNDFLAENGAMEPNESEELLEMELDTTSDFIAQGGNPVDEEGEDSRKTLSDKEMSQKNLKNRLQQLRAKIEEVQKMRHENNQYLKGVDSYYWPNNPIDPTNQKKRLSSLKKLVNLAIDGNSNVKGQVRERCKDFLLSLMELESDIYKRNNLGASSISKSDLFKMFLMNILKDIELQLTELQIAFDDNDSSNDYLSEFNSYLIKLSIKEFNQLSESMTDISLHESLFVFAKQTSIRFVFKENDAYELSVKLGLLGFDQEARQFREFGVWLMDDSNDWYNSFNLAIDEITDEVTSLEKNSSFDLLLFGCKLIYEEFHSNKYQGYRQGNNFEERQRRVPIIKLRKALSNVQGALHSHFQLIMDHLLDELAKPQHQTVLIFTLIVELEDKLKKLDPLIKQEGKLVDNGFYGIPDITFDITKSSFDRGKKTHNDFFQPDDKTLQVKINYFDKSRSEGEEKRLPLNYLYNDHLRQLQVIKLIYDYQFNPNKNDPAEDKRIQDLSEDNAQILNEKPNGKFDLRSIEDWKEFLSLKFNDLTTKQGKTNEEAFLIIIELLKQYLRAFTIKSPYDIDDYDDNYLTANFPRALTGQFIQDCGVYALRIVYMLSLISDQLGLKIQFVVLPNHIGLVISGKDIPLVLVNNNQFTVYVSDAEQKTKIDEATRKRLNLENARTIEELRSAWNMKATNLKNPEDQFIGELSVAETFKNLSAPFRLVDIDSSVYPMPNLKDELWTIYKNVAKSTLFIDKPTDDKYHAFYLRYLTMQKRYVEFHNNYLFSFWNRAARINWIKLKNEYPIIEEISGKRARIMKYCNDYMILWEELLNEYKSVNLLKNKLSDLVVSERSNLLTTGTLLADQERVSELRGYPWQDELDSYNILIEDILKNNRVINEIEDLEPLFIPGNDKSFVVN